jgi:maleylacetate reductase
VKLPGAGGQALFELAARLRAPTSLADLGLHQNSIAEIAKLIDANPVANPRDYSEEDVVLLLEQAYMGTRPMPERN